MIVTIAIDSWKGCLDSLEAARAIEAGLRRVCPELEARLSPLADGGEGTTAALCTPEERITCTVTGPLGDPVQAEYGIRRATGTAVLEMASAAGLPLVPPDRRILCIPPPAVWENSLPMHWNGAAGTSWSASAARPPTMAVQACLPPWASGYWTRTDSPFPMVLPGWNSSAASTPPGAPELRNCRFRIACDVENPLCGPTGASAVYGPQKGAGPKVIPRLDAALRRFAEQAAAAFPGCDPDLPGLRRCRWAGLWLCRLSGGRTAPRCCHRPGGDRPGRTSPGQRPLLHR